MIPPKKTAHLFLETSGSDPSASSVAALLRLPRIYLTCLNFARKVLRLVYESITEALFSPPIHDMCKTEFV